MPPKKTAHTRKKSSPRRRAGKTPESHSASPEALGGIAAALTRLAATPRFDLIRSLALGELIGTSASRRALGELTLTDAESVLMASGSLDERIIGLSSDDQSILLTRLIEFGGSAESTETAAPQPPPRRTAVERPVISSIEAEKMLTEAVAALRAAPNFSLLKLSRLGEFWDSGWPRAPFEEALTLQQVSEMKIQAMLEKRSFGPTKIAHVVKAIERALEGAVPNGTAASHRAPVPPQTSEAQPLRDAPSLWRHGHPTLPSHAISTLHYIEEIGRKGSAEHNPIMRLLGALPGAVTAREAAVCWFRQESPNDIVAGLLRMSPAESTEYFESGNAKIRELFRALAPSESRSWELALLGPGITLKALVGPYGDLGVPADVVASGGRMILAALGARHPIVFGTSLETYYTAHTEACEHILRRVLSALPLADADLKRELSIVLPSLDLTEILSLLSVHALLNEREHVWKLKPAAGP